MGPVGALYTRWLYALARSPAARRLALERLAQSEAEQAAEEAGRPPRLIYAEDHVTHVEIKVVDLPGVQLEPEQERVWWEVSEWGRRRLEDWRERVWLEETDDGQVCPVDLGCALDWARERAAPAVLAGLIVGLPAATALAGDAHFALQVAQAATAILGPVGIVRFLWS